MPFHRQRAIAMASVVARINLWSRTSIVRLIEARGLCPAASLRFLTRSDLITLLKASDAKARFDALRIAFLEARPKASNLRGLPRELRDMIWKFATHDDDQDWKRPRSPPICRVNSQFRAECLPIFLSNITLVLEVDTSKQYRMRKSPGPLPARFPRYYSDNLAHAEKEGLLKYVRRFRIIFSCLNSRTPGASLPYLVAFRLGLQSVRGEAEEETIGHEGLQGAAEGILAKAGRVSGCKVMHKTWVMELVRSIHAVESR